LRRRRGPQGHKRGNNKCTAFLRPGVSLCKCTGGGKVQLGASRGAKCKKRGCGNNRRGCTLSTVHWGGAGNPQGVFLPGIMGRRWWCSGAVGGGWGGKGAALTTGAASGGLRRCQWARKGLHGTWKGRKAAKLVKILITPLLFLQNLNAASTGVVPTRHPTTTVTPMRSTYCCRQGICGRAGVEKWRGGATVKGILSQEGTA